MKSVKYAALAAFPLAINAQELSSAPPVLVYDPASGTGYTSTLFTPLSPPGELSATEGLAPTPTGTEVVTILSTDSVIRNTLSSVDSNAGIPVITPTATVTGTFISPLTSLTSLPNEDLISTFTGPYSSVTLLSDPSPAPSIPGTRTFIEVPGYSLTGLAQTTASTLIFIGDEGQIYTTLVPVGENPTPVPNTGIVGYTDGAGDVQFYTTLDYGYPVPNTPRPDLSTTVTNSFQPYPTDNAEDANVRTVTGVNRYGMSYTSTLTDEGYYPSNTVVSGVVSDGVTSILTNPYLITATQVASFVPYPSPLYNGTTAVTSVGPAGTGVGGAPSSGESAPPEPFEGGSVKIGVAGGALAVVAGFAAVLAL